MNTATSIPVLPVRHRGDACCAPVAAPSLTQPQTEALAERLKAMGDSTRLRLLDLLAQQEEPMCVCDLTPQFEQNQPTISHHLRLLRQAELIDTEKRGIWSYYWATEKGRQALNAVKSLS